jgi:hypothetical protein
VLPPFSSKINLRELSPSDDGGTNPIPFQRVKFLHFPLFSFN